MINTFAEKQVTEGDATDDEDELLDEETDAELNKSINETDLLNEVMRGSPNVIICDENHVDDKLFGTEEARYWPTESSSHLYNFSRFNDFVKMNLSMPKQLMIVLIVHHKLLARHSILLCRMNYIAVVLYILM